MGFKKLVPHAVSTFYDQLVSSQNGRSIKESGAVNFLNEYGDEKTRDEIESEIAAKEIKNKEQ